ncbi:MAG: alpha/beta hydrolase, partial [Spirochaetales bacterium]|nr:alpha/beta hydrolase [Spirochaetales bacterium]
DPELRETTARVLIMVGGKEIGMMKDSARKLHEIIRGSTLKVLDDRGHGETSLLHPREYCNLVLDFVKPARKSG